MIEKLLIPLDGSGFGEETLPWAAALARSSGADVDVIHVHEPHPPDHLLSNTQYQYEGVDMMEYDGRDLSDERAYLEGVAHRLEDSLGRSVHCLMVDGTVSDAIREYARDNGSGWIVMTTHGRTGISRVWLGSVADMVVRHAPWPVLLVRPGTGSDAVVDPGFGRILVPLDGSELAERILPHVVDLAGGGDGTVVLIRIVSPNTVMGTRVLPVSMAALEETRRRAGDYLGTVAGRLARRGLHCETRVYDDPHVARGILDATREERADVVAMATHGYRGMTRAVLGSVADKVLRGADIPLLLLGPAVGHEA